MKVWGTDIDGGLIARALEQSFTAEGKTSWAAVRNSLVSVGGIARDVAGEASGRILQRERKLGNLVCRSTDWRKAV